MSAPISDPTVFDDLDDIQCEEFYGEELPDFEHDDFEYFDADGGITGEAQQFLGDIDAAGGFI